MYSINRPNSSSLKKTENQRIASKPLDALPFLLVLRRGFQGGWGITVPEPIDGVSHRLPCVLEDVLEGRLVVTHLAGARASCNWRAEPTSSGPLIRTSCLPTRPAAVQLDTLAAASVARLCALLQQDPGGASSSAPIPNLSAIPAGVLAQLRRLPEERLFLAPLEQADLWQEFSTLCRLL